MVGLKLNPQNPRIITEPGVDQMAKSIFSLPAMLLLRPIVYAPDSLEALGGNVRFLGIQRLSQLLAGVKFPAPTEQPEKIVKFLNKTYKQIFPAAGALKLKTPEDSQGKNSLCLSLEMLRIISAGEIPDGCAVAADQLTEPQRLEFAIRDNVPFGRWDFDLLANNFELEDLTDWGLEIPGVTFGADGEEEPPEEGKEKEAAEPALKWVPDCLFESNNEFDIPTLRDDLQATQVLNPVAPYGYSARDARNIGMYHFYVDDYRFSAIWDRPNDLINAKVPVIIEPNLSLYDNTPLSYGLFLIFKKRWIARYWQSFGVRVFVDLNVSHKFAKYNLLGVPQGWLSYATRGYSDRLELLEAEYALAQAHSGTEHPYFIVYGGGKDVKSWTNGKNLTYLEQIMAKKFSKGMQ